MPVPSEELVGRAPCPRPSSLAPASKGRLRYSYRSHWYVPGVHRIGSMYGILTINLHEWLICMVNAGKYTIHGSYGHGSDGN